MGNRDDRIEVLTVLINAKTQKECMLNLLLPIPLTPLLLSHRIEMLKKSEITG